jgi:hypothetical protein
METTARSKRFSDALAIAQGACNPSGICHSILDAVRDAREKHLDACHDPAVRLMVYQLNAICGMEFGLSIERYGELTAKCEQKAKAEQAPKEEVQ